MSEICLCLPKRKRTGTSNVDMAELDGDGDDDGEINYDNSAVDDTENSTYSDIAVGLVPGMSETSLDTAQLNLDGQSSVASLSLSLTPDEDLLTKVMQSKLHDAIKRQNTADVDVLLRGGASATVADDDGNTPLHLAALYCDADKIKLFLRRGASDTLNVKNKDGNRPIDIALKAPVHIGRECVRILELYENDGMENNNEDNENEKENENVTESVLLAATERSFEEHIKHLEKICKSSSSPLKDTYIYYRRYALWNKKLFIAMRPISMADLLIELLGKRADAVFEEVNDPPLDALEFGEEEFEGKGNGVLYVETLCGVKQTGVIEFLKENKRWAVSSEEWSTE